MNLSNEDFSFLKSKIEARTKGLKCPMCGSEMELSPDVFQVISYDETDKGITITQGGMVDYLKLVVASCDVCKHIAFFSTLDYLQEK